MYKHKTHKAGEDGKPLCNPKGHPDMHKVSPDLSEVSCRNCHKMIVAKMKSIIDNAGSQLEAKVAQPELPKLFDEPVDVKRKIHLVPPPPVPPLPVPTVAADMVNHPPHYTNDPSGVECIQITEHRNFCIGNAIKYLWRNGLKDGESNTKDLKKAVWYINREIERLEGGE